MALLIPSSQELNTYLLAQSEISELYEARDSEGISEWINLISPVANPDPQGTAPKMPTIDELFAEINPADRPNIPAIGEARLWVSEVWGADPSVEAESLQILNAIAQSSVIGGTLNEVILYSLSIQDVATLDNIFVLLNSQGYVTDLASAQALVNATQPDPNWSPTIPDPAGSKATQQGWQRIRPDQVQDAFLAS